MTISSLLKTAALVGALAPLAQAQAPVPSPAPVPPPAPKPAPAPLPAPRPIVSDRETIQAQVDALNNIANDLMSVGLSEDEAREIVNKIAPKVLGQRPVHAVPATKIQPAPVPAPKLGARIRGKMQTKVFVNGQEVSSSERVIDEPAPVVTPSVKINGRPVALPPEGGKVIVNTQAMDPMPVIIGAMKYPENIAEKMAKMVDVTAVDALSLAKEAGNIKAVNVVLIGFMAKATDIPYDTWIETIKTTVPAKFLEVNLKAFDLGYNYTV